MTNAQMPTDRGWFPDPYQAGKLLRLFDGARWTDKTRPIPENYNAQTAATDQKPAPKQQVKESAPDKPKPPQFTEPAPVKGEEKKESKTPTAPHAKNGTAPMFKSPTAKAARPEDVKGAEKKKGEESPEPAKPAAPTPPPAFAKPTVSALKDEDKPAPATEAPADAKTPEGETPTLEPKKPLFSKPAPTAESKPAAKPNFAPQAKAPQPTPTGPPAAGSVDSDFEENSATVNDAFASTPDEPEYGGETVAPSSSRKPSLGSKLSMPQLDGIAGKLQEHRVPSWAAAVALAVIAIVVPLVGPDVTKSVNADCRPISQVVASYDGEEDFTVSQKAQAELAAAVSTGKLNAQMTELVADAVESNDLESLVTTCLPQE